MSMYDRDWYRQERKAKRMTQEPQAEEIRQKSSISALTIITTLTIILVVTVTIGILR